MTTLGDPSRLAAGDRLACDLHDDVLPALWALALHAQTVEWAVSEGRLEEARTAARTVSQAASDAYDALRRALQDGEIDVPVGDLRSLVESLCHDLAATGLVVQLEIRDVPPLPAATARQVFLIVREALRNVAQHSGAERLRVTARADEGCWAVHVEDDGHGVSPACDDQPTRARFGLQSMKRRAATFGGRCDVVLQPGVGATVILSVPLPVSQR